MPRLIDQDDAVATRTLKVCCIGLPRTGTTTLHTALSKLGYRIYPPSCAVARTGKRDMDLLHEALVLKHCPTETDGQPYGPQDFDKIWGKYDAVGDLPAFAFVDELVAYYPQAQFILTDRNVDAWARAMRATVVREVMSWRFWFAALYDGQFGRPLRRLMMAWVKTFCNFDFRDGLREAYIDHVQHCLKVVPKETLLILRFEEQDDWRDLCEFLEKEVPDEAYPVMGDMAVLGDVGGHRWGFESVVLAAKLYAFALGAVIAAASCWLVCR